MQYHLNGFVPGNLQLSEAVRSKPSRQKYKQIPDKTDVLIIGSGPAGLTLARQLSVFPEIKTCILESNPGPLLFGRADGVSCRTIEIMEAPNEKIKIRSSYNLAGISFTPNEIAKEIKKYIKEFEISYKPDFRQKIADSWPQTINDQNALCDWGWKLNYNLQKIRRNSIKTAKKFTWINRVEKILLTYRSLKK